MKHAGVHHVSLNVHDAAEAGRFYTDVLGMKVLPRPDFPFAGWWLECGGQQVHLIEVEDHQAPEGQHFALHVHDIEAARNELLEREVQVSKVFDIPGVGRQCFFRDPSQNLIELNEPVG